jgi:hypothetical protein
MPKSPTCHEVGVNKPYFANFEVSIQIRARATSASISETFIWSYHTFTSAQVVKGFFEQQEKDGVQKTPAELADQSFGLLDKSPERWENFKKSIAGTWREQHPWHWWTRNSVLIRTIVWIP